MAEKTVEEETTLVRVRCRREHGMYRLAKFWPSTWVEAAVTLEQLVVLEAEPGLVVHIADVRNPDVPAVSEVQPGNDLPPEPEPWKDPHLEKLRQEAIELDKAAAAKVEAREQQRVEAAEEASEARVVPASVKNQGKKS